MERTLELLNEMEQKFRFNSRLQMVNFLASVIRRIFQPFAVEHIPFLEIQFPLKMDAAF